MHVAPSTTLTQRLIRRRPDIAGPAISLLLGTLRRTQEALAALHAMREARLIPFSFNPRRPRTKGPDGFPGESHRAIDYPVFCNPAETPVTVERIRLMYSAFFSSAISS